MGRPTTLRVGMRHFNLKIETIIPQGAGKGVRVLCRCDCGNTSEFNRVSWGKMKSCGCKKLMRLKRRRKPFFKPWQLEKGEAAFNGLYTSYRLAAKRTGRAFKLSKKQFRELVTAKCKYCNAAPSKEFGGKMRYNGTFTYNGIDRVDSKKGYIRSNVCTACFACNWSKLNRSEPDFIKHCLSVSLHYLQVRLDPSTQLEHREVALAILEEFKKYFPVCAGLLEGEK